MGDIPFLVKFGDFGVNAGGKNLLSANEVAAYQIAGEMNLSHAEYSPVRIAGTEGIVCITPCFIHNANEEFVTAHQIAEEYKLDGKGLYRFFADADMKQEVNRMIVFDHLIHNTDRHEKNFGIIRDSDTMEIHRFAPLFDSGSFFGWNYSLNTVDMGDTKPFGRNRMEQLRMADITGITIPEEQRVINILRDTYENFQFPEQNFQIAAEDVRRSYGMLKELEQEGEQERKEDWER